MPVGHDRAVTNLFLTGPRGAGKTMLLFRGLKSYLPGGAEAVGGPAPIGNLAGGRWRAWPGLGGFTVKKVYRGGRRVAFDLVDLATGERATVASFPAGHSPLALPGDERPQVNPEAFERVGVSAVRRAIKDSRVVVMDELGRFELGAPAFLEAVREALDSQVPVIGVLKAESNQFLDAVRARRDTVCVTIDPDRPHDPWPWQVAFLVGLSQLVTKGQVTPTVT